MPPQMTPPPDTCESCKRTATHNCGARAGLLRKCGVPLCDDCTHYNDKRWPIHDRYGTDRNDHQWITERQAEELLDEGELLGVDAEVLSVVRDVAGQMKPVSARQRRKQRDDLVQLLDELAPQTIVPKGMSDTSRPGEPS